MPAVNMRKTKTGWYGNLNCVIDMPNIDLVNYGIAPLI